MKDVEFNLLEENWICVLKADYTVQEVSLTEALLHAQEYLDLAGETPMQDFAILRLLLAVLHTVFERVDENGTPMPFEDVEDAVERWENLWSMEHFPEKPLCDYLQQWHERFWLFHSKFPFWQVPEFEKGTECKAEKLNGELSQSNNKKRLFANCEGKGAQELTYAQAARWLLSVNGCDDTAIKPKVGPGWLGKIGPIMAQGRNLFETLLLNLVLAQDGEKLWGEPRPHWECEMPRSEKGVKIALPDNAAELLTLQSRRILLKRKNGVVAGFEAIGGDVFEESGAFTEQMTIWQVKKPKKNGPLEIEPKPHDPTRQFWREFPAAFVSQEDARQPGVVRWVGKIQKYTQCPFISFKIAAVKYGDKNMAFNDVFCDSLTFHTALLSELKRSHREMIRREVERCEKTAEQLSELAGELVLAAGGSEKASKMKTAKEQWYYYIDQPFRNWLKSIDPDESDESKEECCERWHKTARKIADKLAQEMVEKTGPAAFVGRRIKNGKKECFYAAPKSYQAFQKQFKTIYEA